MRLCLFNRSRLVKAAPQKQMNGFSFVSDGHGQPPPRPLPQHATYGFGHGAPNVQYDEMLDRNVHRSVLLHGLMMGMAWRLGVTGVTWRRGESGVGDDLGLSHVADSNAPLLSFSIFPDDHT